MLVYPGDNRRTSRPCELAPQRVVSRPRCGRRRETPPLRNHRRSQPVLPRTTHGLVGRADRPHIRPHAARLREIPAGLLDTLDASGTTAAEKAVSRLTREQPGLPTAQDDHAALSIGLRGRVRSGRVGGRGFAPAAAIRPLARQAGAPFFSWPRIAPPGYEALCTLT